MHPTRRLTTLAALAALIIAALAATPSAHAASGMEIAVQDDGVFSSRAYYSQEKALKLAQKLRATRIRVNVGWTSVVSSPRSRTKPANVAYASNQSASPSPAARRQGIKPQLSLPGPAPAWA